MLYGDEIRAAVVDVGTSTLRLGSAGNDMPRCIFRSELGVVENSDKTTRFVYGNNGYRHLDSQLNLQPLSSSTESKWQHIEHLIHHGLSNVMRVDPSEYPLMFAAGHVATGDDSIEQILQMCFESLNIPALYVAPTSCLSAFSCAKPTALVIDIGAEGTKISPVVDGYELRTASIYTERGGNRFDALLRERIETRNLCTLSPWFDTPYIRERNPAFVATDSFRRTHSDDIVRDIKKWMSFIPYKALPLPDRQKYYDEVLTFPPPYELPDGTLLTSSDELCTVPESVLFPYHRTIDITGRGIYNSGVNTNSSVNYTAIDSSSSSNSNKKKRSRSGALSPSEEKKTSGSRATVEYNVEKDSLTDLVHASLLLSDADIRKELISNIVLVGGGSLIDGISQRLTYELTELLPSAFKVKTVPIPPIERVHAPWIGGSILGICSQLQPLWLSRREFEEGGALRASERFQL